MSTPKSKKILQLQADSTPTPDTQHAARSRKHSRPRSAIDPARKPRSDSPLNRLPESRRDALLDFMDTHSIAEAHQQLIAEGIQTSMTAVTNFRASWKVRTAANAGSGAIGDLAESEQPPLTGSELFERGQEHHMAQSILNNDPKAWCRLQRARQQEERLRQNVEWRKLEERRVKLLEQRAEQTAKPEREVKQRMTPEERDAELREIFGVSKDYVLPGGVEYSSPQTPVEAATANDAAVPPSESGAEREGEGRGEVVASCPETPHSALPAQNSQPAPEFKPEETMTVDELMENPVRGNKSLRLVGNRLEYFSLINEFPPRLIYEGEITPYLIRISLHYLALA